MKRYSGVLTVAENRKGVLDVDTVKGCAMGMKASPCGGCYGLCYASRLASCYGIDFASSVSRQPADEDVAGIERTVKEHSATWFRIGTMGDPSHDWPLTLYVCEWLGRFKTPVVVTKHWLTMPERIAKRLASVGVVVNTSTSALDTPDEIDHRIGQHYRLKGLGLRTVLRVVTAAFGKTSEGVYLDNVQRWIMMHGPVIDTPLRIPSSDGRVKEGTICAARMKDINGTATISLSNKAAYIGTCAGCPDQCGVNT